MKRKYLIITLTIICIFIPIMMWGNSIEDAKMLDFQQGDGTFESWFMKVFKNLDTQIEEMAKSASFLGRVVGCLGALLYLSIVGWRMQSGDAEWSVEPMIKPVVILIFIINWTNFYPLIQKPLELLAEPSEAKFEKIETEADALREKRYIKQQEVSREARKLKVKTDTEIDALKDKDLMDKLGDSFLDLFTPIAEFAEDLNYKIQKWFGYGVELICLMILRVAVYLVFFIQKIWSYILIVLGPLAVGISLFPGFESSFNNWIAKFININLYGFIAFTVLNIGQQLIMTTFLMDIERLTKIVDDAGNVNIVLLHSYSASDGMLASFLFPCVGYLVTAAGVLMTPTIADSIVSAGGAGIMTKAKGAAGKVLGGTRAAGKGIGTAVGRAASVMGGHIGKTATSIKQSIGTMKGK